MKLPTVKEKVSHIGPSTVVELKLKVERIVELKWHCALCSNSRVGWKIKKVVFQMGLAASIVDFSQPNY
jgi:hypothetical protein